MPGYRLLWVTGLLWHVARWMTIFATSYRLNEETGDPLLVQLVGVAFMAPMFIGGLLAGTISDRIDRNRTVVTTLSVLVPLAGLMALAVDGDRGPLWLSYVFVFYVGVGNVIDMTTRRSIAFGLVGAGLITQVAAFETLALHGGNLIGSLMAGLIIEAGGVAIAYLGVAVVYTSALMAFGGSRRRVEELPGVSAEPAASSMADDLAAAARLIRRRPVLGQFLVTTVVMNFFYYAFVPLIPAFADDLGVGPFLTGLLASALGGGTMIGAFAVSRVQPTHRGRLHVAGAAGAMTMLLVFANLDWYPAALAAIFFAGVLSAGFGTTQAALVISLVEDDVRGRALGLMSMAIGSLPFGMFSLGLIARRTDPQLALTLSLSAGLLLLAGWHARQPHLRRLN